MPTKMLHIGNIRSARISRFCGARQCSTAAESSSTKAQNQPFVFTKENFRYPDLKGGLSVHSVPLLEATNENLVGFGFVISSSDERTVGKKNFEIVKWPVQGWRQLDPGTGDEAGTTEGPFKVDWDGDFFYGHNLAIATDHNQYLDGLGAIPESARHGSPSNDGSHIYLWMSDYHPDGAQLFWPMTPIPFVVTLGPAARGDDIRPEDMRAFAVPAGKGVYFHPGTWHNGVYVHRNHAPAQFLTRQGRVHGRVSCSWASEFKTLLKVPLT